MTSRVVMWSCVSRKTRLKIGLAISQDLKCKTCKTEKLVKIKHFWSFWEENTFFSANTTVIPHLKCFCAANWLAKLAGNDKEINKLLRKKFLISFWTIIPSKYSIFMVSQVSRDFIIKSRGLARLEKCKILTTLVGK